MVVVYGDDDDDDNDDNEDIREVITMIKAQKHLALHSSLMIFARRCLNGNVTSRRWS